MDGLLSLVLDRVKQKAFSLGKDITNTGRGLVGGISAQMQPLATALTTFDPTTRNLLRQSDQERQAQVETILRRARNTANPKIKRQLISIAEELSGQPMAQEKYAASLPTERDILTSAVKTGGLALSGAATPLGLASAGVLTALLGRIGNKSAEQIGEDYARTMPFLGLAGGITNPVMGNIIRKVSTTKPSVPVRLMRVAGNVGETVGLNALTGEGTSPEQLAMSGLVGVAGGTKFPLVAKLKGKPLRSARESIESVDTGAQSLLRIDGQGTLRASTGLKERGVITTARESEFVDPVIKSIIRGEYRPKSNKEVYQWAGRLVNENVVEAEKFVEKMPVQAETTAVVSNLVRKYQEIGDFKKASEIIEKVSIKATKAGQFTQAFSQWKLLTPEGMQRFAEKVIREANENMGVISKAVRKVLGKERIELTNEDLSEINKWMKLSQKASSDEESAYYVRKAFEVINRRLPWGISDVLDEYRYNNMLSNPLTHLRNFSSNVWQAFVVRPLELLAQGKLGEATKYEIGAISAIPDAIDNFIKTLKEGKQLKKMDVDELTTFGLEKPRVLGRYNLPSQLMEAADSLFSTLIQGGELKRGRTAEEAYKTAEYYLFRQGLSPEGQGHLLNLIDEKITRPAYSLRKVGLGWAIPFIRTPMNFAKQWIEFSPVGFATIPGSQDKKSQVAKALIGSFVSLVGLKFALEDRVTGPAPTDPLAKKLFYDSGKKPFSVKIGDVWVPTQAFGSLGFALTLPAIIKHHYADRPSSVNDEFIERVVKSALGVLEYWSNQTFMQNLGDFIKLVSGDVDYTWTRNLVNTANQLKPLAGLMRYISKVVDPIYRKPRTLSETMISDIPFLTRFIPYHETTTGEPSRRLPINLILPYEIGVEDERAGRLDRLYKNRMMQLKENAAAKKREERGYGAGLGEEKGVRVPVTVGGKVKILDLSKVVPRAGDSDHEKAVKRSGAFAYVDDILNSDLPVEDKARYLALIGIDPEDASYYNIARQDDHIKYLWVKDEISKYGNNRQEILHSLIKMRRDVNRRMILTDKVVNMLVDDGVLSGDEGLTMKKIKYTDEGKVKLKLTGRGKGVKIKKIGLVRTLKASANPRRLRVKVKPIKIGGITGKANVRSRGKILKVFGGKRYGYKNRG